MLQTPPADQAAGARVALKVFLSSVLSELTRSERSALAASRRAGGADRGRRTPPLGIYASLFFGRTDLTLLTPSAAPWGCEAGSVCVASKCEARAWREYRCVNDLAFYVIYL